MTAIAAAISKRLSPAATIIERIFVFIVLFLVFFNASTADAQRSPVGAGFHKIQGRVRLPSNNPASAVRVRLENPNNASMTSVTDNEGMFYFGGLDAGRYTVIIEAGGDYETFSEVIEIDPPVQVNRSIYVRPAPQTFNIIADLRLKGTVKSKPGVINAALAAVPKPALKEFRKALEAQTSGDVNLAIEKFSEAVRLYPQFFEAHAELGSLYLKTNRLDKAIESLRAAIALNDKNASVRLNYGVALLNKKEMAEAEKELREAIKADSAAPTAYMYLGIALLGLKRTDEAEAEFLRAISLKDDEKVAQAHRYLGGIHWGKGKYAQAADELEKYLKLAPKVPDADKIREIIKQLREQTK